LCFDCAAVATAKAIISTDRVKFFIADKFTVKLPSASLL
jgi:hypothetical protein